MDPNDRFEHREEFKDLPLKRDFAVADRVVSSLWSTTVQKGAQVTDRNVAGLLKVVKETVISHPRPKKALDSFPTMDEVRLAFEKEGTAQTTVDPRTPEWLEENGT